MQDADRPTFDRAFTRLCAAFDTPPTDVRKAAYFVAFRRLPILEFAGLVDLALEGERFTTMPTVGALWQLRRSLESPTETPSRAKQGPSIQERLSAYVVKQLGGRLTAQSRGRPWTYLYREYVSDGKRCADCVGVLVELDDGSTLRFNVADMEHVLELA